MSNKSRSLHRELLATLLISAVAGWLTGEFIWCFLIGSTAYTLWVQWQLARLYKWAINEQVTDPPVSHGVWGDLFERFHRVQKQHLKNRARLKKVIKRFRDSTFALHDGFVMLDSNDNLDWWNPAAERLLGLRSPDQGLPITNLLRDPKFKNFYKSKKFDQAFELKSPINQEVTLHFQFSAFGKHDHLIVVRDITELKKIDKVRTDFVGNVSHELRTPLTVLNGYLENMSESSDNLPPAWEKAIGQMQEQARRMSNLIQDLLLLSNLEAKRSSHRHSIIDMGKLLTGLVNDLGGQAAERQQKLNLAIKCPAQLLGQRDEIYSLASNLIINAIKYSPTGSKIEIIWELENDSAILGVKDNGPGIEPQHIHRLTERFYRVDNSRAQNTGGTGLGLAIVKHILINHDAQLIIDSKVGIGSLFSCQFPAQRVQSPQLKAASG